ncbi:MAG: pectate lyase [Acidobacteria bacterium]|nr:pectate lyase [Acidobacteriota bacterium]
MKTLLHVGLIALSLVLIGRPAFAQATAAPAVAAPPDRAAVLDAMKRATVFMVEKVGNGGGYVWSYLPDLSRRWGEMEARDTTIWIQPPGTPAMGHLFLDAYHATGDEYYYRAAEQVAGALIWAQLPAGGWNYMADRAGEQSLRAWYDTIGRNAWRLEEFQHYWGNATFDDGGTAQSATLLLRVYLEKHDPRYKPALDKAIQFFLDSQYPVGAWPQRFPLRNEFSHHGRPDYTSFLTFNDEVTAGNVEFLISCYQALGDARLLGPIRRGMEAFLATQQGAPQPGWALQYTPDLKPAGARTYEPAALATHTTAACIEQLLKFYRLTGDTRFLARVPEALDWLDAVRLPADIAAMAGRSHPTFVAVGTNKPLYVHRRGSNVVNGEYYVDEDPRNTIGHYSSFREIDVSRLRQEFKETQAIPPAQVTKGSPLVPGAAIVALPRYFEVRAPREFGPGAGMKPEDRVARAVASLDARGRWITDLGTTSHPYRGDGSIAVAPGDFSRTEVGDESDTSPFRAAQSTADLWKPLRERFPARNPLRERLFA